MLHAHEQITSCRLPFQESLPNPSSERRPAGVRGRGEYPFSSHTCVRSRSHDRCFGTSAMRMTRVAVELFARTANICLFVECRGRETLAPAIIPFQASCRAGGLTIRSHEHCGPSTHFIVFLGAGAIRRIRQGAGALQQSDRVLTRERACAVSSSENPYRHEEIHG